MNPPKYNIKITLDEHEKAIELVKSFYRISKPTTDDIILMIAQFTELYFNEYFGIFEYTSGLENIELQPINNITKTKTFTIDQIYYDDIFKNEIKLVLNLGLIGCGNLHNCFNNEEVSKGARKVINHLYHRGVR